MVAACRRVPSVAVAAAAAATSTLLVVPTPTTAAQIFPIVGADAVADAVLGRMDRTADPCVDAVQWACGGWAAKAQIPPSKTYVGSFGDIRDRVVAGLDRVLCSPAEAATPVGTPYAACARATIATARGGGAAAKAAGMEMLGRFAPALAAITTDGTMEAVVGAISTLHSNGGGLPLVDSGVSNSRVKHPEMVLEAYRPDLGMSSSGFRADTPIGRAVNAAYRTMLEELLSDAGEAGLLPIGPSAPAAGGGRRARPDAAAAYWRWKQEATGTRAPPDVKTRCVERVGDLLPWGVGDVFVRHFFDDAKTKAAMQIVNAVQEAYPKLITGAKWLDAETRAAAIAKFVALTYNVAHFSRNPTDAYDDVVVSADDYPGSWASAARHACRNEYTIAAGILQSPIFDPAAPAAQSYGSAGFLVGHEITHAFDNRNRRLGGNVTVDGSLTLPDNLADAGGVASAALALNAAVAAGQTGPANARLEDAFTPQQLFYLGYAQTYCRKRTPRSLLERLSTNRHAPARFRLQGGLSQHPGFATAFSCAPGTPYNPPKRCSLW
ncbi:hypothetical protein I4F81_008722 [Pyropia yezoensis]|uniref:Uncharacterized protein n=1 Tax=Pyropia yezoensis TaxID=2788 RepID=A0ACC3C8T4_PYRYE|nr:hypothetical protein I4F81_008722 [Neopyropia yezoensis]